MEENNSFTFLPQYLEALEELDDELKFKACYYLCFYGVTGEIHEDADMISKMFIKANQKMIDGNVDYRNKQQEKARRGGRTAKISDEQIKEAYIELYKRNGKYPTEQEVIDFCGGTAAKIRDRKVWKERELWNLECLELSKMNQTNVENQLDIDMSKMSKINSTNVENVVSMSKTNQTFQTNVENETDIKRGGNSKTLFDF